MTITVFQYSTFEKNIGFLIYKQQLVTNRFWLSTFYIHVFTCIVCLLTGAVQFSNVMLHKYPLVHRFLGKIYFYNIIIINFPAGLILAIYANGNLPGKLAFVLLSLLWVCFTINSVVNIRNGNIQKHKDFMIRSYSLTLTALSLRILKFIMSNYTNWSYNDIYVFNAWVSLFFNLCAAEVIIKLLNQRSKFTLLSKT